MKEYKGYTDYYGEVEEITITGYDNNKYADIIRSDSSLDKIKRGYIYKDFVLTEFYSRIVWHCLGGGNRINFIPRKKEIYYVLYFGDLILRKFNNKKQAVKYGSQFAVNRGGLVVIYSNVLSQCRYYKRGVQDVEIYCDKHGFAWQFGGEIGRMRGNTGKYIKGYGKRGYSNNKSPRLQK